MFDASKDGFEGQCVPGATPADHEARRGMSHDLLFSRAAEDQSEEVIRGRVKHHSREVEDVGYIDVRQDVYEVQVDEL